MWRWARSIRRSSSRSFAACSSDSVVAPARKSSRRADDRPPFFANTSDAERDLIAYRQMVKLVEEAHLRYTSEHKA
jgi:hypothetical protein